MKFHAGFADVMDQIFSPWMKCAMTSECIEPGGASRSNHRFDQVCCRSTSPTEMVAYVVLRSKVLVTQFDRQRFRSLHSALPRWNCRLSMVLD